MECRYAAGFRRVKGVVYVHEDSHFDLRRGRRAAVRDLRGQPRFCPRLLLTRIVTERVPHPWASKLARRKRRDCGDSGNPGWRLAHARQKLPGCGIVYGTALRGQV